MTDPDLMVVGGGPAGCAAAVMAASLGLRSVLIEPGELCHKLAAITSTVNILGGFATGAGYARRVAADVAGADGCELLLGQRAVELRASGSQVTVETGDGTRYRAPFAVVATGVRPQAVAETGWITQPDRATFPALWEAAPEQLAGTEVLVLGVDRPLGTFLRSHPDLDTRLLVVHEPAEEYKAGEVGRDPRVVLLPARRLELLRAGDGTLHARVAGAGGEQTFVADRAFLNLGSRPVVPAGDLVTGHAGYCPPGRQHPRVLVAGDLRGARYQRVMTAVGSGAEAALRAYYALRAVAG